MNGEKLWDYATNGAALDEIGFTLPARGTQKSRPVRQQLWARTAEIADGKRGRISGTRIVDREIGEPAVCRRSNGAC